MFSYKERLSELSYILLSTILCLLKRLQVASGYNHKSLTCLLHVCKQITELCHFIAVIKSLLIRSLSVGLVYYVCCTSVRSAVNELYSHEEGLSLRHTDGPINLSHSWILSFVTSAYGMNSNLPITDTKMLFSAGLHQLQPRAVLHQAS